jgi:hypothetical protein
MALTACRECGTAVPAHSHACPQCAAEITPVVAQAYRPPPPRPQEPERPAWKTAAGWRTAAAWVVLLAGVTLAVLIFLRWSGEVDQAAVEKDEMAREVEHMGNVLAWVRDTSASAAAPDSAGRPVPTSDRAKRVWAINRMLVDRTTWEREVMKRHGVGSTPAAWLSPPYQANARDYPQVGRYLERRAAAMAEVDTASAGWMEARTAALARETGMPAGDIRGLFPPDFARPAEGEVQLAAAMLELHRSLVRMDPRVRHAGGDELRFEREEDVRRLQEMEARLGDASNAANRGRQGKINREIAALNRWIQ